MKRDLLTTVLLLGLLALCGCERGEAREIALVVAFYAIPALLAAQVAVSWGLRGQLDRIEAAQQRQAAQGATTAIEMKLRQDRAASSLRTLIDQGRSGWTWRMWRRLRGLPVVALLALLGCEAQTVAPDEDMAGGEVVTPSDLGTVKLYKPCTPATKLDTVDHCGSCERSCRGAEWPGFPAACCPPRPGSQLTYCTILNTPSDCGGCGDICPSAWRCQAGRCVP